MVVLYVASPQQSCKNDTLYDVSIHIQGATVKGGGNVRRWSNICNSLFWLFNDNALHIMTNFFYLFFPSLVLNSCFLVLLFSFCSHFLQLSLDVPHLTCIIMRINLKRLCFIKNNLGSNCKRYFEKINSCIYKKNISQIGPET